MPVSTVLFLPDDTAHQSQDSFGSVSAVRTSVDAVAVEGARRGHGSPSRSDMMARRPMEVRSEGCFRGQEKGSKRRMQEKRTDVGFIGLGQMGRPMARRLLEA